MKRFPASPAAGQASSGIAIRRASFPLALALLTLLGTPAGASSLGGSRVPAPKAASDSSNPLGWVGFEGRLAFFTATTNEEGSELWVTDGTAAGTRLLVDACPGTCSSNPVYLASSGGRAYFSLLGNLWATNGTPQRTRRLTSGLSINPGTATWIDPLGRLFFRAIDFDSALNVLHGNEPWVSDGTLAGTHLLADLNPGTAGSDPAFFLAVGTRALFRATDSLHGTEVWTTDGTAGGTRLVKDLDPGPRDSVLAGFRTFAVLGNRLYFVARSPATGYEIWSTDGTANGTRLVKDLARGAASPQILDALIETGGKIYFVADTGSGQELWSTRGSGSTTVRLTQFPGAQPFAFPGSQAWYLTPHAGALYFFADDGGTGLEPWRSDGTAGGTRRIADLCRGACSSGRQFLKAGSRLYAQADDGLHGVELWTSDGTAAGTRLALDACPGACSSLTDLFGTNGEAAFFGTNEIGAQLGPTTLWKLGGGTGPVRLTDPAAGPQAFFDVRRTPSPVIGSRFFFSAVDDAHGAEPWSTDGTPEGTRLFLDLVD